MGHCLKIYKLKKEICVREDRAMDLEVLITVSGYSVEVMEIPGKSLAISQSCLYV